MRAYYLKVLGSETPPYLIEAGKTVSVGRDEKSDIVLPNLFGTATKQAVFELRKDRLLVSGFGVGGIVVNGRRLLAQTMVRAGDKIQAGRSFLLVEAGEPLPAPPPPTPLAMPEAERPRVPSFEILGEIAAAAAWKLYHAREGATGREVGLKLLDAEQMQDAVVRERFEREGRALQKLDHPNVLRILDVGEVPGGPAYHVNEYVPGAAPLSFRLRQGPLGLRLALQVGIQVADALALAHEVDVIHRDVAPSSILVTPAGIAKLHNFACVRLASEKGQTITTLGEVIGTVAYCAPEQLADPRKVGASTDLYSLGATLYHAISGRPPFQGPSYIAQVRLVMTTRPEPLETVAPETPPAVLAAVAKLMAPKPEDRCQSAAEAGALLLEALLEVAREVDEPAAAEAPAAAAPAAPAPPKPPPPPPGRIAGAFSGAELLEICQLLESGRKSGTLTIKAPPISGALEVRKGEIVQARTGALGGRSAVEKIIGAESGTFEFIPGEVQGKEMRVGLGTAALSELRRRDALRG